MSSNATVPPEKTPLLAVGLYACTYSSAYGSDKGLQRVVATSYAEVEKKFHGKFKNFIIEQIIYEGVVGL